MRLKFLSSGVKRLRGLSCS